jgi:YidC/Oxa1 family membrane protein insertase
MEGQGKRLLLAVVLALGVMVVWNMIFGKKTPEPTPGSGSGAALVAPTTVPATTGVCHAKATAEAGPESRTELAFPNRFTATFSNRNGALVGWRLVDERFAKDPTKGELLPATANTGAFQVGFWRDSTHCLPAVTSWTLASKTETELVYTWSDDKLALKKTFTLVPDNFIIRMKLEIVGKPVGTEVMSQKLVVTAFAFQDPKADVGGGMQVQPRHWVSSTLREGELLHTPLKELQDGEAGVAKPRFEPNVQWTGFEHPFLLAAYAPRRNLPTDQVIKHTYPETPYGLMRTDLEFGPVALKSGGTTVVQEVVSYLGPKYYTQLDSADQAAGFETGFRETVDLGWFAIIGRPLMWLLLKFQSFVGNWGIAIILLTFLVKGTTLFWTTKSMRSMKQMAALAPQLKALQEKYKGDRQRIQVETMALYKHHKVNPIAGCLPILLQMPIWLALYRMLSTTGELYQQPFIGGWIDDLTNTDPFHILPVLLLVTMFVQARLTPQTGDSTQQKFLQWGMPLMFGVMGFFFPAGLSLYIFTNTVLAALHSVYMNKYDKKTLAIVAQMTAASEKAAAAADKPTVPASKKVIDVEAVEKPAAARSLATDGQARPRRKKKKR